MFGPSTMVTPSAPSKTEIRDGVDYRPKSVRDLANRFEQILLSPPSSSSTSSTSNNQVVSRKEVPEVPADAKHASNGYTNQLIGHQYPDNMHGQFIKDNSCTAVAQQMRSYDKSSAAVSFQSQGLGNATVIKNNTVSEIISESQGSKFTTSSANKIYDNKLTQGNPLSHLRSTEQTGKSTSRDSSVMVNNGLPHVTSVSHYSANSANGWSTYDQSMADTHQNYGVNYQNQMNGSNNHRPEMCYPQQQDTSYGENMKQTYYNNSSLHSYSGSHLINGSNLSDQHDFPPPPPSPLLKQMMGYSSVVSSSNSVTNDSNKDKVLPSYNPPPPVGPRGTSYVNGNSASVVGLPNPSMINSHFQPSRSPQTTCGVSTDMPKKKKGKKSVTFSDQIALVACADDDVMALPNPLLEKVLHKSSSMTNNNGPPTKTVFNPLYIHSQVNSDRPNGQNGCVTKQYSDSSTSSSQMNGNYSSTPGYCLTSQYPNDQSNVNNKSKLTGTKVLCSLCGKKTVLPPTIYCLDCDFYMSRFKPKK